MKSCGHTHHVGTCPSCQSAQLERWQVQLDAAKLLRHAHVGRPTVGMIGRRPRVAERVS